MEDKVYIVLLNYNGWKDSIECMESLLKLNYSNYQIILVDNASTNNSVEKILDWTQGKIKVELKDSNTLKSLVFPLHQKPLDYKLIEQKDISVKYNTHNEPPLIIIKSEGNNGFSAGNNLALKYALAQNDASYFWILNNDTVVKKDALKFYVSSYKEQSKNNIGLLGCKVKYYHFPEKLQCAGGAYYNKWLAYSNQIGNQEVDKGQFDNNSVEPELIIGASMFVSKDFVADVGLLGEDYFLYYEEQDWAERARRKGYKLGYTYTPVVYHKEGGSIGGNQLDLKSISKLSDFYYARNKIIFTRKFYNILCISTVYLSFILIIINRVRRGQSNRVPMLIKILFNSKKHYENT